MTLQNLPFLLDWLMVHSLWCGFTYGYVFHWEHMWHNYLDRIINGTWKDNKIREITFIILKVFRQPVFVKYGLIDSKYSFLFTSYASS